jgi:hypothetical protein
MFDEDAADHRFPAAVGHVHVDEHDLRRALSDHLDRGLHLGRLPHHVRLVAELGANAAPEEVVVVDEEDPHPVATH